MPDTMYLTGDPAPRAGYCGGCGQFVTEHHTCQPASRVCQWCGHPAEVYDVDGSWCTPQHRDYDRASESTIRRRWEP